MPDTITTTVGLNALGNGTYGPTHMELSRDALTGGLAGVTSLTGRIAVIEVSFLVRGPTLSFLGIDTDDARSYDDWRTLAIWDGAPDVAGSRLLNVGSTGDATIYGPKVQNVDLIISGGTTLRGNIASQVIFAAGIANPDPFVSLAVDEALVVGTPLVIDAPNNLTWDNFTRLMLAHGPNANRIEPALWLRTSQLPSPPVGGSLYVAGDNQDQLYTIDITTGAVTGIGTGFGVSIGNPSGMTSHNGILNLIDLNQLRLYTVDVSLGTATLVGLLGLGNPAAIASFNGVLYAIDLTTNMLYTVNPTTGQSTAVSGNELGVSSLTGLTAHAGELYAVRQVFDDTLYTVNSVTGIATSVGSLGLSGADPQALASHGGVLYTILANGRLLYSVNPATGAATQVGSQFDNIGARGMASHAGGGDFLAVSDKFQVQRTTDATLTIFPIEAGYLHEAVAVV